MNRFPTLECAMLKAFVDRYLDTCADIKPGTLTASNQGRDSLVESFGADKPFSAIEPGDCDEYRLWLRNPPKHELADQAHQAVLICNIERERSGMHITSPKTAR